MKLRQSTYLNFDSFYVIVEVVIMLLLSFVFIVYGFSTEVLIGFCMAIGGLFSMAFIRFNLNHPKLKVNLNTDETVIIEGNATYINGSKVKGHLYLTNHNLKFCFASNQAMIFPLDNILHIKINKLFHLFQNGIRLVIDGKEEVFLLEYPEGWKTVIESQMNHI